MSFGETLPEPGDNGLGDSPMVALPSSLAQPNVAPLGRSVSDQMRTFQEVRRDEARRLYHKMVAISFGVAAAALLLLAVAATLQLLLDPTSIVQWIWPCGVFVLAVALVLLSSCPFEEVDLDEVLESRPLVRIAVSLTAFGIELLVGIASKPYAAHILVATLALLLVPPRADFPRLRLPRATLLLGLCLAGERCATILSRVYIAVEAGAGTGTHRGMDLPGRCWWILAGVCLAAGAVTLGVALLLKARPWRERNATPTEVFGNVLQCHFLMVGIDGVVLGSLVQVYSTESRMGAVLLLCGTAFILPLLLLACGPKQIFELTLNRFIKDSLRGEKDGAFIAGLIDSDAVASGQVWWIHRLEGEEDRTFDPSDHRHHWRRGVVIGRNETEFTVALPTMRRGASSSSTLTDEAAVHHIPLGLHNTPWPELVVEAQTQLRCIDWKKMSRTLIASGVVCGTADKALLKNQYYSLSRDAGPTEIDYFMSHSWHDDPDAKWEALQKLSKAFKKRHGRYPTFWLDKACIDQENLADGLRVLPVNVMACRRVLVLCGETYTQRLWCIWELFTLMAFASIDEALERLHVVPLNAPGSVDCIRQLMDFEVDKAHCYDPNEERRLKRVIEGLGKGRFNLRVRELGAACLEAQHSASEDGILRYSSKRRGALQRVIQGGVEVAASLSARSRNSVDSNHNGSDISDDNMSMDVRRISTRDSNWSTEVRKLSTKESEATTSSVASEQAEDKDARPSGRSAGGESLHSAAEHSPGATSSEKSPAPVGRVVGRASL